MAELHIYEVLRRPIVTEKTNMMMEQKQYVFEVALKANKVQIREAVELLFDVEVVKVNTLVVPAKRGRRGRNWYMRTRQWKKAIVTLTPDSKEIELFKV